ncbi:hypothetical protein [Caballeronia concitans]|uniref:hypothetical protein n=1 Tax=Caballeronia concitans TaxID=1777133 RepID=UPI00117FF2CE|nr:hypothetical protein [Caballeronia concitans]
MIAMPRASCGSPLKALSYSTILVPGEGIALIAVRPPVWLGWFDRAGVAAFLSRWRGPVRAGGFPTVGIVGRVGVSFGGRSARDA